MAVDTKKKVGARNAPWPPPGQYDILREVRSFVNSLPENTPPGIKSQWETVLKTHPEVRSLRSTAEWENWYGRLIDQHPDQARKISSSLWGDTIRLRNTPQSSTNQSQSAPESGEKESPLPQTPFETGEQPKKTEPAVSNEQAKPESPQEAPVPESEQPQEPEPITAPTEAEETRPRVQEKPVQSVESQPQQPAAPQNISAQPVVPAPASVNERREKPAVPFRPQPPAQRTSQQPDVQAPSQASVSPIPPQTESPLARAIRQSAIARAQAVQQNQQVMSRSRERLANQRADEATKKVQVAPATPLDNRTKSILTVVQARPPQINYREEAFQKKKRENKKYQKVESEMKKIWDGKYVYTNDKTHKNLKRDEYDKLPAQDRQDYTQKVSNDWDHKRDRKPFRQWVDHQFEEEHPHEKDEMFRQEQKKIYQKAEDDPLLTHTLHKAEQEFEQIKADISPLDPPLPQADIAQIKQAIEDKHMEKFVQELPEKAAAYQQHEPAIQRIVQLAEHRDASQPSTHQAVSHHTNSPTAPLFSKTPTPFPTTPRYTDSYSPEDYFDQESEIYYPYSEAVNGNEDENEVEIESIPEEVEEGQPEEQYTYTAAPRRGAEDIDTWRQENKRRQSTADRYHASSYYGGGKNGPPRVPGKIGKKIAGKIGKQAAKQALTQTARGAIASTGVGAAVIAVDFFRKHWKKIVVGVFLFILFIYTAFFGNPPFIQPQPDQPNKTVSDTGPSSIPGLTKFTKTGPEHVDNGQIITYTISAEYSGTASIKVQDAIPTNTEFVDCNGCQKTGNSVSWTLAKGSNSFSLSVRPTANDIIVVNQARAGGSGNSTPGVCPSMDVINTNRQSPEACQYLNPPIDIFDTSFSDAQIQAYITAYQPESGRSLDDFTARVQQIVSQAQKAGFNPLIPLAYWKSESGFGNGFGCPALPNVFEIQLNCVLGGDPNVALNPARTDLGGGAAGSQCARAKDPQDYACRLLADIRKSNAAIYSSIPIQIPIRTFDDFAEAHGSRAPDLEVYNCIQKGGTDKECATKKNRNCTHTYNILLEVASVTQSCKGVSAGGTGGLAACSFVRKNDNKPYSSPLLLSYFEEVSQKTGVPAVVLAAITKVESTTNTYNISEYTDTDITQMDNPSQITGDIDKTIAGTQKALCPRSPTGALGLMQLQPSQSVLNQIGNANPHGTYNPKPSAYCENCVNNGLRMARDAKYSTIPNAASLTMQDYCDPRLSLYMGAGFILEKLATLPASAGGPIGDGKNWNSAWNTDPKVIEALVTSYYGRDADTPMYVQSIISSLNSCSETSGPVPTPTPAPGTTDLRQQLMKDYGITFNGFDQQHLQWAQRKLQEVSGTKFASLVNGAVIQAIDSPDTFSEQVSCPGSGGPSIRFHQNQVNQEVFDITLIHELAHLIQNCQPNEKSFNNEYNNAHSAEQGITYYAQNAGTPGSNCPKSDPFNEDYAEMIAYYLNPNAQTKDVCGNGRQPNPYSSGNFSQHQSVARKILGNFP